MQGVRSGGGRATGKGPRKRGATPSPDIVGYAHRIVGHAHRGYDGMARTAAARVLLAVASALLLLIAGCATGAATAGAATATTTQGPASGGSGGGAGGGASRSGAEGELVKDDAVRTGSPARRRDGSDAPHAPGRGFQARGADEHGGDAQRPLPRHRTAPSRGTPAAQRATLLQVFRR
ncbi:hypothetical protein [Streptomyces sp. TS71-3]|uniref:hypothetical protein n=1 Tax=Streptomyces sp. TS71-3 TaxID=2733862 RepID=UPI001B197387|nr:hypothetical protein [Streptomyces sp. TS71-3]GHJ38049.1 hypothetical protein Sm713_36580 [Streptomyces sp. TS71-3]